MSFSHPPKEQVAAHQNQTPDLDICQQGDKYEQEAENVAEHVMTSTQSASAIPEAPKMSPDAPAISKMSEGETSEKMRIGSPITHKMTQGGTDSGENSGGMIQMKDAAPSSNQPRSKTTPKMTENINSMKGNGQRISSEVSAEMGNQMGADFSNVKVHTGAEATQMNEELGSRAFTSGQDIFFNQGQYNPGTPQGKNLLAHELTHTVQQGDASNTIQRAMKFEFQTGNYIWKVKKSGSSANPLPRKYGSSGATEDGGIPAYLHTGSHGDRAFPKIKKGGLAPIKKEGDLTTKVMRTHNYVEAPFGSYNPKLPAQYVVPVLVNNLNDYVESGEIPLESDIQTLTTQSRQKSIMDKNYDPSLQTNQGTYEFKYYDKKGYVEAQAMKMKSELYDWNQDNYMFDNVNEVQQNKKFNEEMILEGNDHAHVHRNEQGAFVPGHVENMIPKDAVYSSLKQAQYERSYKFNSPVDLSALIGNKLPNGSLTEMMDARIDNASLLKEGTYEADTYEMHYFDYDGTKLEMHIDQYQRVQKGHVPFVKIGFQDPEGIDFNKGAAQFTQDVVVAGGISSAKDLLGKDEDEIKEAFPDFSLSFSEFSEQTGDHVNMGTYMRFYETAEGSFLNVHQDRAGVFQPGSGPFLEKITSSKKAKEQTGMELQSETDGFLEFETPKWFQKWSELKPRIEDAKKMTEDMSAAPVIADDSAIGKAISRRIPGLISGGKRRDSDKDMGELHEFPFPMDHLPMESDETLVVEIQDANWSAAIQVSEGIQLSQYQSLLEQHEYNEAFRDQELLDDPTSSPKVLFTEKTLEISQKIFDIGLAFGQSTFKNEEGPTIAEEDLGNLKGLIQIISNYLLRGQYYNGAGNPSKFNFLLMARTSFYSMYHDILSPEEQQIFDHLVANNVFVNESKSTLREVIIHAYGKKAYDDYKASTGIDLAKVNKYTKVFRYGYGSSYHSTGPSIDAWLNSIIKGGGKDPTDPDRKTDLLSRPSGGSASMGRFDVETKSGKKDSGLVRFEMRVPTTPHSARAADWVTFAEDRFKEAAELRPREAMIDDPTTKGNDTTSTGLIYDP